MAFLGDSFSGISDEKKWSPEVCLEGSKMFFCLNCGQKYSSKCMFIR